MHDRLAAAALISQIPNATNDQLATLVVLLAACLWVAVQVKTLFERRKPAAGEGAASEKDLDKAVAQAQAQWQERLQAVADRVTALAGQHGELTEYTRSSIHEVRDKLNALQLRIEATHLELKEELHAQTDKLVTRISSTDARLERVLALLEQLLPRADGPR